MKVVHIAFQYGLNNTGGAAIASTRLHQALLERNIESHYICIYARETGINVHELPRGWKRMVYLFATKVIRRICKHLSSKKVDYLNIVPLLGLENLLFRIKPDVVHVQWLNADVAPFEQIAKLPYQVVLNLHDLNLVLPEGGGYPSDNRFKDGVSKDNTDWLNLWLWRRKARMIKRLNPNFIGPSRWVIDACAKSICGRGYPAFAISNIIDPVFYYIPELCKQHKKFVILFGAYKGRANHLKGWKDLESALSLLPDNIKHDSEVYVFGENAKDIVINGVQIRFLGPINNPIKMRELYHQADVFAFPSMQETQGMTKAEAMLCGLPVVAFNRTACAEGIEHAITGWISKDVYDFSKGLCYFYEKSRASGLSRESLSASARLLFSTTELVDRVISVYGKAKM